MNVFDIRVYILDNIKMYLYLDHSKSLVQYWLLRIIIWWCLLALLLFMSYNT